VLSVGEARSSKGGQYFYAGEQDAFQTDAETEQAAARRLRGPIVHVRHCRTEELWICDEDHPAH